MKKIIAIALLIKMTSLFAFTTFLGDDMLSGDIVGNGWTVNHNDDEGSSGRLEERQIKERNLEFEKFLEEFEFDSRDFRSGDIVGNGSGFHENQAEFFYQSLAKNIVSALGQHAVLLSDEERKVLRDILNILLEQRDQAKIIFLNESDVPGFFYDPMKEGSPRIAKTGFDSSYPIYVNRDMVEKQFNHSPLTWVSLLVHELGHQTGVSSHSFLDRLGSKVRLVLSLGEESIVYPIIGTTGIQVMAINHYVSDGLPDLIVLYNGQAKGIGSWDVESLNGVCGNNRFDGFHLINMHWKDRSKFDMGMKMMIPMGAWAHVRCHNLMSGAYYNRIVNLEIKVEVGVNHLDLSTKFDYY